MRRGIFISRFVLARSAVLRQRGLGSFYEVGRRALGLFSIQHDVCLGKFKRI